MPSQITAQTEKTLLHHLQAFQAGDVDAIMADYTGDAVLITPNGVRKGHEQIRALFKQVFTDMFPPDSTSLEMLQQIIEGEIAYTLWSARSAHYTAPLGTDTFVIRDGKIVAHTFAQLEAKKPA
jgi:ketosteroid isomerase-like protein